MFWLKNSAIFYSLRHFGFLKRHQCIPEWSPVLVFQAAVRIFTFKTKFPVNPSELLSKLSVSTCPWSSGDMHWVCDREMALLPASSHWICDYVTWWLCPQHATIVLRVVQKILKYIYLIYGQTVILYFILRDRGSTDSSLETMELFMILYVSVDQSTEISIKKVHFV